jgi:alpha-1,3-glucosyltransferase
MADIHFQYNGMLIGLLILSITLAQEGKYLQSVACWCVLANMKHLFLGCAPLVAIHILKMYCLKGEVENNQC